MTEQENGGKDSAVQIRPMCPGDIPAAAGLERQVFSEPWSEQGFADALAGSQNIFLVAERAGRLVGYAGFYGSFEEGDITNVAVEVHFRRQKIGLALVEAIKRAAASRGTARIFLEVRASNEAAQRLYCRAGFEACGRRKNFYRQPVEDAILMCVNIGGNHAAGEPTVL